MNIQQLFGQFRRADVAAPATSDSSQIGYRVPNMNVSSNTLLPNPYFRWWDAPVDGSILFQGNDTQYGNTVGVSVTTIFYVDELTAGCQVSERVSVTALVDDNYDKITVSGSDGTESVGIAFTLTANPDTFDAESYIQFVWYVDIETGSGIINGTITTPDNFINITATSAGTYIYQCVAYDPDKDIYASNTITIIVS